MSEKDPLPQMPSRMLSASTSNTVMGELVMAKFDRKDHRKNLGLWGADANWLLGTVLPPFQRPVVWDEERMMRFIESAWLGLHLGTYVMNDSTRMPNWRDQNGQERYHPTDRWLIDGQQRLASVDRYLDDAFPVFGRHWSQLRQREQDRFEDIAFPKSKISLTDENDLRDLYDRMNFGGVAHTEEQRALPHP